MTSNIETKLQISINEALKILRSGGQKITPELTQSWFIALNDCDPQHINKAVEIVLKDKTTDYLIKPGKFRDICLQIKRAEKAESEAKQNPTVDNYSRNKEISTTEARRIQTAIKKGLPSFKKIPCPKIDMVEYLSPEGKTEKIVAVGHVDLQDFENNCANQFLVKLKRKFHGFHREERKHSPITKNYRTMVQCASSSGGAPITIGIV